MTKKIGKGNNFTYSCDNFFEHWTVFPYHKAKTINILGCDKFLFERHINQLSTPHARILIISFKIKIKK